MKIDIILMKNNRQIHKHMYDAGQGKCTAEKITFMLKKDYLAIMYFLVFFSGLKRMMKHLGAKIQISKP